MEETGCKIIRGAPTTLAVKGLMMMMMMMILFWLSHFQLADRSVWHVGHNWSVRSHTKCLPESIHDFVSECIHCNINITIDKRVVYIKDWFGTCILCVHHLLDKDGSYLTFEKNKQLFPNVSSFFFFFFTYGGVTSAIRKCQLQTKVELITNYKAQEAKVMMHIQKDNKLLKSLLIMSDALPTGVRK